MHRLLITPEIAKEFLEKNSDNRKVNNAKVTQYANDISSGNFLHCYSPIILGKNKRLIDGQHRLLAVVKSGCECSFYFVETDFENFRQLPIDIGKPRMAKDYAIGGKRAAAIATMFLACDSISRAKESSPVSLALVADSIYSNFQDFCTSSATAPLVIAAISHFCSTGDSVGLTHAKSISDERFEDLPKRVANWYRWYKNNTEANRNSVESRVLAAISFLQALSKSEGIIFKMYRIEDGEFQPTARKKIFDPVSRYMAENQK
jgi:hypothetical protein